MNAKDIILVISALANIAAISVAIFIGLQFFGVIGVDNRELEVRGFTPSERLVPGQVIAFLGENLDLVSEVLLVDGSALFPIPLFPIKSDRLIAVIPNTVNENTYKIQFKTKEGETIGTDLTLILNRPKNETRRLFKFRSLNYASSQDWREVVNFERYIDELSAFVLVQSDGSRLVTPVPSLARSIQILPGGRSVVIRLVGDDKVYLADGPEFDARVLRCILNDNRNDLEGYIQSGAGEKYELTVSIDGDVGWEFFLLTLSLIEIGITVY